MAKSKSEEVLIKKYANRRLYDTGTSSYVTLEDLRDMVRAGAKFRVKDAKTGEDLTRSTLTQIIFDMESRGYNLLPENFLRQVIAFYDNSMSMVLTPYLDKMMENFVQNQDQFKSQMESLSGFSPIKQLEEISKKNVDMFETTMSMFDPFGLMKKGFSDEQK